MALREFTAYVSQAIKRLAAGIAQSHTGISQPQTAAFLDEQADAQVLFKNFELPTDGAVGDVQLLGRLTHAVQAGGGFKSTQGI